MPAQSRAAAPLSPCWRKPGWVSLARPAPLFAGIEARNRGRSGLGALAGPAPQRKRIAALFHSCILTQLNAKCNPFKKNKCAFRAGGGGLRACARVIYSSLARGKELGFGFCLGFGIGFILGILSIALHAFACLSILGHANAYRRIRFLLPFPVPHSLSCSFSVSFSYSYSGCEEKLFAAIRRESPPIAADKKQHAGFFLRVFAFVCHYCPITRRRLL